MRRLSFALPEPALAWLHSEAQRLGISVGELLRRLIDKERTAAAVAPQQRP